MKEKRTEMYIAIGLLIFLAVADKFGIMISPDLKAIIMGVIATAYGVERTAKKIEEIKTNGSLKGQST